MLNHNVPKGMITTVNWSVEFDEKSILGLVAVKPEMTFKDIMTVITNEGGYVDAQGIVHKGTAVNKTVYLD